MSEDDILKTNEVIKNYFSNQTKADWIPVKEIMPDLVKAGIFNKDFKKGMPFRKVLRALDGEDKLGSIPAIHADRKGEDIYWYLVRDGATYTPKDPNDQGISKSYKRKLELANSDQYYIINLCNELLQENASRQHKFGFLLSDVHKDGVTTSILPVDAYYDKLNLVLEFKVQYSSSTDKSNWDIKKDTYSQRKKKGLSAKDIDLVEIDYSMFPQDTNTNKLLRVNTDDVAVLRKLLKSFL